MMYDQTIQAIAYQDYPIQYPSSPSTGMEEIDADIRDSSSSIWIREKRLKKHFYHSLIPLLKIDWSSVLPNFEIESETSLEEVTKKIIPGYISEEDIAMEMVEHDFIVKMPPKKKYKIQVLVKSIRKGEPRVIESNEFSVMD